MSLFEGYYLTGIFDLLDLLAVDLVLSTENICILLENFMNSNSFENLSEQLVHFLFFPYKQ